MGNRGCFYALRKKLGIAYTLGEFIDMTRERNHMVDGIESGARAQIGGKEYDYGYIGVVDIRCAGRFSPRFRAIVHDQYELDGDRSSFRQLKAATLLEKEIIEDFIKRYGLHSPSETKQDKISAKGAR